MAATVRIPTPLRKLTNEQETVEVESATIGTAVEELEGKFPGIKERPTYQGYRLVKGYPEFRYRLGRHEIRERIQESADKKGIVRSFSVHPATAITFRLTPTDLAIMSSSAGSIPKDGALKLTAKQSTNFTITLIEKNPAPPLPGASFE